MIYAESLRHFVQEWVEIRHPDQDNSAWRWDRGSKLYLVNLYSIADPALYTVMPTPFISILINGIDNEKVVPDSELYRGHFKKYAFKVPRRYLYNPLNKGERNIKTSRYSFTSDSYGEMASNWDFPDLRLLRILGDREHVRYSIYNSGAFQMIRSRLNDLERVAEARILTAENLIDCTIGVSNYQTVAPELMLIQTPIIGILKPIKKSKEYKIVNAALVLCNDILVSVPTEPSAKEYEKVFTPFKDFYAEGGVFESVYPVEAKSIAYLAVECRQGVFNFQEYFPGDGMISSSGRNYRRVVNHLYTVGPERGVNLKREVRLQHTIAEGLIPDIPSNRWFLTKTSGKLFYRSDMPDGYIKEPGGNVRTEIPKPAK